MDNLFVTPQLASGLALYAVVRQGVQFWNGSAVEAYNGAHWSTYVVAASELGTTGLYSGTFPAAPAGRYDVGIRQKPTSGSTAAVTDAEILTLTGGEWDGSAWILPSSRAEYTAARATKLDYLDVAVSSRAASVTPLVYGSQGSLTVTYTVHDTDNTTPLPGAAVYVSADSAGTQRSEVQLADALGRTFWLLDPGVVYFWRSAPRRAFVNPDGPKTVS